MDGQRHSQRLPGSAVVGNLGVLHPTYPTHYPPVMPPEASNQRRRSTQPHLLDCGRTGLAYSVRSMMAGSKCAARRAGR
jgi:hypothetical protein